LRGARAIAPSPSASAVAFGPGPIGNAIAPAAASHPTSAQPSVARRRTSTYASSATATSIARRRIRHVSSEGPNSLISPASRNGWPGA
jgi:hypothetical protein